MDSQKGFELKVNKLYGEKNLFKGTENVFVASSVCWSQKNIQLLQKIENLHVLINRAVNETRDR